MKTNKKITLKQKTIIIAITVLMLFNFIVPNYSQATFGSASNILVAPITFVISTLGDMINYLLAYTLVAKNPEEISKLGDNWVYITDEDKEKEFLEDSNNQVQTKNVVKFYTDNIIGDYGIPNIQISAEEIFSNKVSMLDANYFSTSGFTYNNQFGGKERSTVEKLKDTVAGWYKTLRMIAIVGLLSVLVYIGIRIIISAAAADKAKYKTMLKDWLVALCLIFFLHYIMVFTMTIVQQITSMLAGDNTTTSETTTPVAAKSVNIEVHNRK